MKNYIIYSIIAAVIAIAGGFIGWHLKKVPKVENIETMVPVAINFDSLKALWMKGKLDSVILDEKNELIASLENKVNYLSANDTLQPVIKPIIIPSISFDTSQNTMVHAKVIQGEDTLYSFAETKIRIKANFFPNGW